MKPLRRLGLQLIALSVALCVGSLGLYQLAGGFFVLVFASPVLLSLGVGMAAFPGNVEPQKEAVSLSHDWERLWMETQKRWRLVWLLSLTIGVSLSLLGFAYWLIETGGQL